MQQMLKSRRAHSGIVEISTVLKPKVSIKFLLNNKIKRLKQHLIKKILTMLYKKQKIPWSMSRSSQEVMS